MRTVNVQGLADLRQMASALNKQKDQLDALRQTAPSNIRRVSVCVNVMEIRAAVGVQQKSETRLSLSVVEA